MTGQINECKVALTIKNIMLHKSRSLVNLGENNGYSFFFPPLPFTSNFLTLMERSKYP